MRNLLDLVGPHLPYLRRYARALTGDQMTGDGFVRIALEVFASSGESTPLSLPPRLALYRSFHAAWGGSGVCAEPPRENQRSATDVAVQRLMHLAPLSRQAFLLTGLEGFTVDEAAQILDASAEAVESGIAAAQVEIDAELATTVLIIEDEHMIAADIEGIVTDMGHQVIGIAATRVGALDAVARAAPGLIIADIQLADGSSGIDAVNEVLRNHAIPVIFVTAFPERLLTGDRPEPTLLISKPFLPASLQAVVGQALFFHPRRESQAA